MPEPITTPTREELIARCERASVLQEHWWDRDSAGAQRQVGELWALLRAGCDFRVATDPKSDNRTQWIEVSFMGFNHFEWRGINDSLDTETFYLPTDARLNERDGKDWYC